MDAEYAGAFAQGIALDLQRLRRRGIALPGLEAFQRELAQHLDTRLEAGLAVTVVVPGGQAEKAGIKVGDRFLTYNGDPVLDHEWFTWERQVESRQGIRGPRTVVVMRDGQRLTFELTAGRLGLGLKAP
jgi:S1-C subfamily serine protease